MLRRLGNKKRIASKIYPLFPSHTTYIEPFFGAGGMFFSKRPRAKYNVLNDLDSDVFNLFQVVMQQPDELREFLEIMPQHQALFDFWKTNFETDPVRKAARFLMLSNFGYMGKPDTYRVMANPNGKKILINDLKTAFKNLQGVQFSNKDAVSFLKAISLKDETARKSMFIYLDPPYLNTTNNYECADEWQPQNLVELLDQVQSMKINFALSEFDNPFVLEQAKERGLFVHEIGERVNMKNRMVEVLVTNYEIRNLFN